MIYFFLSSILIFLGKTIADITALDSRWEKSWFGKFGETSYFGPKSKTSGRKDSMGTWISSHTFLPVKFSQYLAHTILVPLTDIWHSANTIRRIGIYLSVFFALCLCLPYDTAALYTVIFAAINQTGFWLLYDVIKL